ncbi:MAG: substrate-binding domain-containing protein [Nitrospirae bacterium]|nr:substrate-binding domain-containing protein [Nitrospirota bacterium]
MSKGEIIIGGTGSALGSMAELSEAFQKRNPGVSVKILPSLGSGGGIKAAIDCVIDIGIISRPLKEEELRQGVVDIEYAVTPFVFVTSKKTEGLNFTLRDIAGIYSGEIKTWPDGSPVRLILRPASDSDTLMLKGMSPEMDRAVGKALLQEGMIIAPTDQDSAGTAERVSGSLGTSTLSLIISEKRRLNMLSLNGVAPGVKSLSDGAYPFYKKLFLVTGPKAAPAAKKFIEFIKSGEGSAILSRTGYLPLTGKK